MHGNSDFFNQNMFNAPSTGIEGWDTALRERRLDMLTEHSTGSTGEGSLKSDRILEILQISSRFFCVFGNSIGTLFEYLITVSVAVCVLLP